MDASRHRYPFVILIPLFFLLFLSAFGYRFRGESRFRSEPLGTPPHEPSLFDIQFYYDFKKIYTDILLELPKDDQVLAIQVV